MTLPFREEGDGGRRPPHYCLKEGIANGDRPVPLYPYPRIPSHTGTYGAVTSRIVSASALDLTAKQVLSDPVVSTFARIPGNAPTAPGDNNFS